MSFYFFDDCHSDGFLYSDRHSAECHSAVFLLNVILLFLLLNVIPPNVILRGAFLINVAAHFQEVSMSKKLSSLESPAAKKSISTPDQEPV
jgi:hypothetical protein